MGKVEELRQFPENMEQRGLFITRCGLLHTSLFSSLYLEVFLVVIIV
jgi:hypothetical protein